jgi:hypothetical protein
MDSLDLRPKSVWIRADSESTAGPRSFSTAMLSDWRAVRKRPETGSGETRRPPLSIMEAVA